MTVTASLPKGVVHVALAQRAASGVLHAVAEAHAAVVLADLDEGVQLAPARAAHASSRSAARSGQSSPSVISGKAVTVFSIDIQ